MTNHTLYFVTGNANKLKEAKEILSDFEVIGKKIDLPEIQEMNEELIATEKVRHALKVVDGPVCVEDVSLCFEALNGLPGPFIKWFLERLGRNGLADLLANHVNKKATAKCTIGYGEIVNGKEVIKIVQGVTTGRIVESSGESSFGFDPIFVPDGFEETYAEMSAETKNKISHRGKAFSLLKKYLD
jgi:inosine triphosphate pyrophosphatase